MKFQIEDGVKWKCVHDRKRIILPKAIACKKDGVEVSKSFATPLLFCSALRFELFRSFSATKRRLGTQSGNAGAYRTAKLGSDRCQVVFDYRLLALITMEPSSRTERSG